MMFHLEGLHHVERSDSHRRAARQPSQRPLRPDRGRWFLRRLATRADVAVDFVDLGDRELPAVFSAEHSPAVRAFASRLDRADAFVVMLDRRPWWANLLRTARPERPYAA